MNFHKIISLKKELDKNLIWKLYLYILWKQIYWVLKLMFKFAKKHIQAFSVPDTIYTHTSYDFLKLKCLLNIRGSQLMTDTNLVCK